MNNQRCVLFVFHLVFFSGVGHPVPATRVRALHLLCGGHGQRCSGLSKRCCSAGTTYVSCVARVLPTFRLWRVACCTESIVAAHSTGRTGDLRSALFRWWCTPCFANRTVPKAADTKRREYDKKKERATAGETQPTSQSPVVQNC